MHVRGTIVAWSCAWFLAASSGSSLHLEPSMQPDADWSDGHRVHSRCRDRGRRAPAANAETTNGISAGAYHTCVLHKRRNGQVLGLWRVR